MIFTNKKGETSIPFYIFKEMPLKNIMKAIEGNRKKKTTRVKGS